MRALEVDAALFRIHARLEIKSLLSSLAFHGASARLEIKSLLSSLAFPGASVRLEIKSLLSSPAFHGACARCALDEVRAASARLPLCTSLPTNQTSPLPISKHHKGLRTNQHCTREKNPTSTTN